MSDDSRSGDFAQQMLDMVEQSQKAILDAVRQWAEAGAKIMPELPSTPLTDLLPKPDQVMAGQFEVAEQLIAAQRRFAEDLLTALRPSSNQS
jgi:hypothetical protein